VILHVYIDDVHRFSYSKQLVAYFGLNPVVDTSGKSKHESFKHVCGYLTFDTAPETKFLNQIDEH
jgi:hypothetical protein